MDSRLRYIQKYFLPDHTIDPYFVLSDNGAHRLRIVCTEGKIKPCDSPCIILHAITPWYPSVAINGKHIVMMEVMNMATNRGYFTPNFFPKYPAIS